MSKQRDVTLMVVPSSDNQMRMIRGILDYARDTGCIRIAKNAAIPYAPWSMIGSIHCDGIIAYAESSEQLALLTQLNLPAVNVTMHMAPTQAIATVHSDNRLIGQLAAQHLASLGLKKFAVVGHFGWHHNCLRRDGFVETLCDKQFAADEIDVQFESEVTGDVSVRRVDRRALREALAALQFPIGVFATQDEFAYEVVDACHALNRSVPFDISVLGVNDNRMICETTTPTLSSIAQNSERIGYLAAELLTHLIDGGQPPQAPICVAPAQIIVRRSSDYLAIDDASIVPVVQFIRERCHRPISAQDVAEEFDLGRKLLDKKFRQSLGHSVTKELRLERIRLARRLLASTDMSVIDIGLRCGFESASGFVRAFRESTGCSPGQLRRGQVGPKR